MDTKSNSSKTPVCIGLILSYQCNLRCTYCYIPRKRDAVMKLSIATQALTPLLSTEGAPLLIEIVGAEPLTAYERLREIVNWAKSQKWARVYSFFATTNGTLLNDERKKWFYDNREWITLGLSYDGTSEAHNQNRSKSSPLIDMDFFLHTWPQQAIKMTISVTSVNSLAQGVISLSEEGFAIMANPAYENHTWKSESICEYAKQLDILIHYYVNRGIPPTVSLFDHNILYYAQKYNQIQGPFCGACSGTNVIDIDGEAYPCQMLSPLVIDRTKALNVRDVILSGQINYADPACQHCVLHASCPTCMASNYLMTGNFAKHDQTHCVLNRLEVLATCKLYWLYLKQNKHFSRRDRTMAKAILFTYLNLRDNCADYKL